MRKRAQLVKEELKRLEDLLHDDFHKADSFLNREAVKLRVDELDEEMFGLYEKMSYQEWYNKL